MNRICIKKFITNAGFIISFILIFLILILAVFNYISIPPSGFILLPLGLILIIIIATGDFNIKIKDLIEVNQIKKEIKGVQENLAELNIKISNVNTNQNITILSVSPSDIKGIIESAKSKTEITNLGIIFKSLPPDSESFKQVDNNK